MSIKSALPVPILIADANIHTRRLFQNELRLEGFTNVTTVGTAQELIERTQELKPTIVITSALRLSKGTVARAMKSAGASK